MEFLVIADIAKSDNSLGFGICYKSQSTHTGHWGQAKIQWVVTDQYVLNGGVFLLVHLSKVK